MQPADFTYIQVSLDGGSPGTHDGIRGTGTFGEALTTNAERTTRGFGTRIICTVNQANTSDARGPSSSRPTRCCTAGTTRITGRPGDVPQGGFHRRPIPGHVRMSSEITAW
jgi:hypothetical protein